MRFPLAAKLALGGALIALASVGAVFVALSGQIEDDARRVFTGQQEALANNLAHDLDDKLRLHLALLRRTANMLTAEDVSSAQRLEPLRPQLRDLSEWFDGVAVIDLHGDVAFNDPPRPGVPTPNVADRDYFRQALAGSTVISPPLRARTPGAPVVVLMSTPVSDGQGRPAAVLAVGLNLGNHNVLGAINQHPIGLTGHVEVVTRGAGGVYVVHPDSARLMGAAPPERADDSEWLVARVSLSTVPWELRVKLPAWEAHGPAAEAQRRLMRVLLATALGASLVAGAGAYVLAAPLRRLTRTIRFLRASPEQPVALGVASNDERGDLAREFESLMTELRAQRQDLVDVSAAAPLGLFLTDTEGNVVWANDAFLRKHEIERDEMARGWMRMVAPERREAAWSAWAAVIGRAETYRVNMRMRRRSGEERVFEIRTRPRFHDGVLNGHAGSVTDVTDRVDAVRAQRVLAEIVDASPDPIIQTDARGHLQYVNRAAREKLGWATSTHLADHHFLEFATPETEQRFRDTITPAVTRVGYWRGETTARLGGHEAVMTELLVLGHRDEAGNLRRVSGTIRDISDRHAAQQALARQTAVLVAMADAIPAVVAVVGRDLRYRFVNAAFRQWTGKEQEQIVGHTIEEVIGTTDFERSRTHVEAALQGEVVTFERSYQFEQDARHLAVTYIPLVLEGGEIDGFVGVITDVTLQRRKEWQLARDAERDALTGLLNRAGLRRWLEHHMANHPDDTVAVLYVDLDRFKPVNDEHGHPTGDRLLRELAGRLRERVRPADAVARLGGDEFALILAGVRHTADAAVVAEKVVAAASQAFDIDGKELRVGASVGVAVGRPDTAEGGNLLQEADARLYQAKAAGRGRVAT